MTSPPPRTICAAGSVANRCDSSGCGCGGGPPVRAATTQSARRVVAGSQSRINAGRESRVKSASRSVRSGATRGNRYRFRGEAETGLGHTHGFDRLSRSRVFGRGDAYSPPSTSARRSPAPGARPAPGEVGGGGSSGSTIGRPVVADDVAIPALPPIDGAYRLVVPGFWRRWRLPDGVSLPVYPSLGDAIDASANGDVILVHDGTYSSARDRNLKFGGRRLTIRSLNGRDRVIMDLGGGNGTRAFVFDGAETPETAALVGITIRNGNHGEGGAILCKGAPTSLKGSPLIDACAFLDCRASESGGAVSCRGNSVPVIRGCLFAGNRSGRNGGAIAYSGWARLTRSGKDPALADDDDLTPFADRVFGSQEGGDPCTYPELGVRPRVQDCEVRGNLAERSGGGIWAGEGGRALIERTTISGNVAGEAGGGVACVDSPGSILADAEVTSNFAGAGGGGLWLFEGVVRIANSVIAHNITSHDGGGVWYRALNPAAMAPNYLERPIQVPSATIASCTIRDNVAGAVGVGGGVYIESAARGPITGGSGGTAVSHCFIAGNRAGRGGGVFVSRTVAHIWNCVFQNNVAQIGDGGAIAGLQSSIGAVFCTIVENQAVRAGGGVYMNGGGLVLNSTIVFWNSVLLGSPDSVRLIEHVFLEGGAVRDFRYCCIPLVQSLDGVVTSDPQLNTSARNGLRYVLNSDSPCRDRGMPTLQAFTAVCLPQSPAPDIAHCATNRRGSSPFLPWPLDIDGQCRRVAKDPSTGGVQAADVGAYEVQ